jgi:Tol biopolymer transport system component
LRRTVRRCLEKHPEERFQSARDLAFVLRQLTGSVVTDAGTSAATQRRTRAWQGVWVAVAGCAIGILVTGAAALRSTANRDAEIDPVRLTRITADRANAGYPAFSPDGRSLAFLRARGGLTELLVTSLDSPTPMTLVRSETTLGAPAWSADGNQVCYTGVERSFTCISAAGGVPRPVLADVFGPQIGPDGTLFFVRAIDGAPWLLRRAAAGGEPERVGVQPLPADVSGLSPVSPDGSALVALAGARRWLVSLSGGARRELPSEAGVRTLSAAWLGDSRHIVVAEAIVTSVIGYRLVVQDTRSTARRVIVHSGDPIPSVAADPDGARVVYSGGSLERDLVEFSADGRFVRTVAASALLEGFPSWAPTGDRFVYRAGGPGQSDGLWLGRDDAATPMFVQPLGSNTASQTPVSPDGQRIAYVDAGAIYVISASGGRPVRVLASPDLGSGLCWSPDGEWIWYSRGGVLGRVPSAGGEPVSVEVPRGPLLDCSPDGRWLVRRGTQGFVLTSTDGRDERPAASYGEYASRAATSVQFGAGGTVLYLLRLDRRTIDVLDVERGRRLRSIAFDLPPEDDVDGFSFSPDGARVLLTVGGDRNELWMVEGYARPATSWTRWFRHWAPPAPAGR